MKNEILELEIKEILFNTIPPAFTKNIGQCYEVSIIHNSIEESNFIEVVVYVPNLLGFSNHSKGQDVNEILLKNGFYECVFKITDFEICVSYMAYNQDFMYIAKYSDF